MSIASAVAKIQAVFSTDLANRAFKTFVEATAAQAALYTTVVPNTPGVKTGVAVSVGATVLSLVWNGLVAYATKTKSAKLDQLATAIDKAVDARLAAQAVVPPGPGNAA